MASETRVNVTPAFEPVMISRPTAWKGCVTLRLEAASTLPHNFISLPSC
jgi:hypothetical protein